MNKFHFLFTQLKTPWHREQQVQCPSAFGLGTILVARCPGRPGSRCSGRPRCTQTRPSSPAHPVTRTDSGSPSPRDPFGKLQPGRLWRVHTLSLPCWVQNVGKMRENSEGDAWLLTFFWKLKENVSYLNWQLNWIENNESLRLVLLWKWHRRELYEQTQDAEP